MLGALEFEGVLGDVVYLAVTVGFFAFAMLAVRACRAIVADSDGQEGTS
jgi:hypothetical protein